MTKQFDILPELTFVKKSQSVSFNCLNNFILRCSVVSDAAYPESIKENTRKMNFIKNKAINSKRKFKSIIPEYFENNACKNFGTFSTQLLSLEIVNSINGSNEIIPTASKIFDITSEIIKIKKFW